MLHRMLRSGALTGLALLASLCWGGCFSSCEDPASTGTAGGPVVGSPAPDLGARALTDPETQVARGEAIVRIENGRATVLANEYPRLGLLGKLSREAGFEQERRRTAGSRTSDVTVRVIDAGIEEAIAGILAGLDYHLHYRFDEAEEQTKLAKVTIGELGDRKERGQRKGRNRPDSARNRKSDRDEMRERASVLQDRGERLAAREEQIRTGLLSGDEEIRVSAVDRMKPEGDELQKLKELLSGDPSPSVRASAAERLEGGYGGTAVDALISALNDPSPMVVSTAIEALEFAAEPDHIPAILQTGVTHHPDPEVRAAALEALEFIED